MKLIKTVFLMFAVVFLLTSKSYALDMGFNQGWFEQNFNTQWMTDRYFQAGGEAERILDLVKAAKGAKIRMWVFQGLAQEGILWGGEDNKTPIGLDQKFQTNMIKFLLLAKDRGIRVNLTLFAATQYLETIPSTLAEEEKQAVISRMQDILNLNSERHLQFQKNVLQPLLDIINDRDLRGVVSEIDIMNEFNLVINTSVGAHFAEFEQTSRNTVANHFICSFYKYIKENTLGVKPLITASVSGSGAEMILNNVPTESCVDYFTVHNYADNGNIPNCNEIRRYAGKLGKFAVLGEFGQGSMIVDDAIQSSLLHSFIENARACGFKGAMAWRLSDIRPGEADERFSFEAVKGVTRPAYDDFWFLADRYGTEEPPIAKPIPVQLDPPPYYRPGRRKRFEKKWCDFLGSKICP